MQNWLAKETQNSIDRFGKSTNSPRKRVCVIGLDGTPYSLLKSLCDDGAMPCLAEIVSSGVLAPMTTALPEISSVAWTSFMTGKNPAKHGIYGFSDLKPNSYAQYFPNSSDIRGDTLWRILDKHGKRTVAINIPATYPAQALNGLMIAGFVALDLDRAVYPQGLAEELRRMNYRIDIDLSQARESKESLIAEINETLDNRTRVISRLMAGERWDLFIGVITETDRLHHFLWDAYENGDSLHHQAFIDIYAKIDRFIGEVWKSIKDDDLFIILSDHGFCRVKKQVYLNHWLKTQGFLHYKTASPQSIADIDGAKTKAFCLDPGRIYLNVRGKFPDGIVDEADRDRTKDEIKSALAALTISADAGNEPVIKNVYEPAEIYDGPFIDRAPDLLALPNRGWDLKGSVTAGNLTDSERWTGMHTHDNAACFVNKPMSGDNIKIFDLLPTILGYLDIPLPADIDGKRLW